MALDGNRLGPRGVFVYGSDSGLSYKVRTDSDNAAAGGFVAATNEDDLPRGMRMRYLNCQIVTGGRTYRKRLYCAQPNDVPYTNNTGTTVTIDGAAWTITGKVGEKLRGI